MHDTPAILIVDDTPSNLYTMREVLQHYLCPCYIVEASSARQGLELTRSMEMDCILVDLQMPEMDGIAMCRQLKQNPQSARSPVILMSAHQSTASMRAEALDAGADDFINRPIDSVEFVARVRTALRLKKMGDELLQLNNALQGKASSASATLREYLRAVESSEDLIATVGEDFRLKIVNNAFLRFHNFRRRKVIGQSIADIWGKDFFEAQILPWMSRCFLGEQVQFEARRTHPLRGEVVLHVRYSPIMGAGKTVQGVVIIARDITEQNRARQELDRQRQFNLAILDHIDEGIVACDMSGTLSLFNQAARRLHGRPFEPLNPEQWAQHYRLFHNDERTLMTKEANPLFRALEGEPIDHEEMVILPKGQQPRHVQASGGPLFDSDGTPLGALISLLDLSDRRAAQQESATREAQYHALFQNNHSVMLLIDPDSGEILDANEAAARFYGYPQAQLKTLKITSLNTLSPEELWRALNSAQNRAEEASFRFQHLLADGSMRDVEVFSGPINYQGRIVLYSIVHDITERLRGEKQMLEATKAAEEASLAKSSFLANMSHELRTPMNGILGMTELVLESRLNAEQRECLGMARDSAHTLLALLNDLLDLSRIEARQLELRQAPVELNKLLNQITKSFSLQARQKGLIIHSNLCPKIPLSILGDETRLGQILINLLGNAIKFTHQGRIDLQVKCSRTQRGEEILFSVEDTGIGIEELALERIFDRFAQADASITRQFGGSGLGLAISKELVQLMDGRIWAQSRIREGSSFHFSFPLRDAHETTAGPDPDSDRQEESTHRAGIKILVAEDHEINQRLARKILERGGHRVTLTGNGALALKSLSEEKYDLVLMDIQMPVMNGLEAAASIRRGTVSKEATNIPIVAMTAHASEEDRSNCFRAGMNDYLSKPFTPRELLNAVERAIIAPQPLQPQG